MSCWSWADSISEVEAGIAGWNEWPIGIERCRVVPHGDDGELPQSVLPGRERERDLMNLPGCLVGGEDRPGGHDLPRTSLGGGAGQVPLVYDRTAQVELSRRSGREARR